MIQTEVSVENHYFLHVHLFGFVHVLRILLVVLGRNMGDGTFLHLVLAGRHMFLYARINSIKFKTLTENV